jgi:hypothetical protein
MGVPFLLLIGSTTLHHWTSEMPLMDLLKELLSQRVHRALVSF